MSLGRYNKIRSMDISNGPGIRVSIFFQGCSAKCPGCFNPETHDFAGGKPLTMEIISHILDLCDKEYIQGLSILGGEPLHWSNIGGTAYLCQSFKERFPDKDIWLWTGNTYNELMYEMFDYNNMLGLIDVLVDGIFDIEKKDYRLKYSGSTNQRVIDLKVSNPSNIVTINNY